jgi:hypothetical protein
MLTGEAAYLSASAAYTTHAFMTHYAALRVSILRNRRIPVEVFCST